MNNNKKTITICSIAALIILAIVIVITLATGLASFSIALSTLFIILTVCLGIYLKEEPDEYQNYIKNKNRILRTYDSIIVEVEDIPNIAGKNIIKVKSIEDLVDAQLELREPIYYKNDNDSCFFMLLHYNEACIYILRMNHSTISPTEQSIRYMKEDPKEEKEENILENVENTIVYKLDELRSFKISPIRNENKISVVNDQAIKASINSNVTKDKLEDEISKTMYIKDLKAKMKQYEETGLLGTQNLEETNSSEKETVKKETAKKENVKKEPTKKEFAKKEPTKKEPAKEEPTKKELAKETKTEEKKSSSKARKESKKTSPKKAKVPATHAKRRSAKYATKK